MLPVTLGSMLTWQDDRRQETPAVAEQPEVATINNLTISNVAFATLLVQKRIRIKIF